MGRPSAGSRLYALNELATNIMKQLAGARRTHRWCKEFPVIQNIVQSIQSVPRSMPQNLNAWDVIERSLEILQKTTLATFLVIDHIGWLKQVKILSGGKRAGTGTIQLGLKFFCASNLLGMLFQLKKLKDAQSEENDNCGNRKKIVENATKHTFLVIQTAHLSRTYETHDALVGLLGMVTSAMDVLTQWPQTQMTPKVSPDAKAMPKLLGSKSMLK